MSLKSNNDVAEDRADQLEHQRLTSLINSMADAVIAVDQDNKIVLYNGAALNIFDVNTINVNSDISDLFRPIDSNNQPYDVNSLIRNSKIPMTSRDLRLHMADGTVINIYLSIAPVHVGYGISGQRGHVLLLRDITREKSLEEERDEFISVVSHELRTPIAISEGNIGNAQYIVERGGDIAAVRKALADAHSQVMFLADIINDLATLSRAERGMLKVEIETINVHDLIKDLSDSYKSRAENKGLKFIIEFDPKLELIYSNKLYVREILQNFITNAIKYTQKGHITLMAKTESKGATFSIEDTGIGISKSDQERVYDKFFRSEDYRTRTVNGTGLGLYVTLKLAHLIHAELSLKSQVNEGSVFTVFVPNLE
ncbi:MAG TPA: ATP-binding protein [Candidatus Saccharimonadales bacterium]|nr:ATP-binding protein [Candidatus Saccharimonadales bacterium]